MNGTPNPIDTPAPATLNAPGQATKLPRQGWKWGRSLEWGLTLTASLTIAAIVLIFVFVFKEALPLLTDPEVHEEVSLETMFVPQVYDPEIGAESVWQPVSDTPKYGIWPLIVATLKISFLAVFIALPIGLLSAIFSSEFAPRRIREVIKPAVEILAGIPSVVLGFFALMVLATWLQDLFGWDYRLNSLVAAVALSIAVIPIIYSVSEDALIAVPKALREASAALGATPIQTTFRAVIPAALPGLFGAVVLAIGRVVGETMVVLMASGNAAILSWSPFDSARTISASIAAEMAEVVHGSPHYHVLFFLGIVLLIFTTVFNWVGDFVMHRFLCKVRGHE